jgi:hypothetical protein
LDIGSSPSPLSMTRVDGMFGIEVSRVRGADEISLWNICFTETTLAALHAPVT